MQEPAPSVLEKNELVFSNAHIVLEQEVVLGSISIKHGKIASIDQGMSVSKGAIDCDGDFICPGLVELHTDNLERHMQPRPGVQWPRRAAVLSHDGELASVGITTVFDALRVGSITSDLRSSYRKYARDVVNIINQLQIDNLLRVSHKIHLRAEICTETLFDELAEFSKEDQIGIVSLMDHTPGQRQFRDIQKMKDYLAGKYRMSDVGLEQHFDNLYRLRDTYGEKHKKAAVEFGKSIGAVLASHDDTTLDDVRTSVENGIQVAEFPTTYDAAKASSTAGIAVMMGAPNLVRGGSHSGNISAMSLVQNNLLDVLSSDYAPSSLLMGAVSLGIETGDMAAGIRTVTANPARAVNLNDRGSIRQGLRADLVWFSISDELPRVKGVWRQGIRIG